MSLTAFDPASFRDPEARVYHSDGRVFRAFNARGAEHFRSMHSTGLLGDLVERKMLIGCREVGPCDGLGAAVDTELLVEHPRVPFISYAYEWPFEMLREAALLELDLQVEALGRGFTLKDAKPENVQFLGARPVHIDVSSFEPWQEGTPWKAYAQFCRTLLNPLLLEGLTGVRFQPWLRGSLEGIAPEDLSRLLPLRKKLRRGIFSDVVLQGWLNRRFADLPEDSTRGARSIRVGKEQLVRTAERLRRTIARLKPRRGGSVWTRYEQENTYGAEAQAYKEAFVKGALAAAAPRTVWDLGCNTGRYSLLAASLVQHVVAIDQDPDVVEALHLRTAKEGPANVLCLTMDLMNPSPPQGWAGQEVRGLLDRGRPDFCLALALVHHLSIAGNVPLDRVVDWLACVAPAGVVEFVPKSDPQAQRLLRWREDVRDDYDVVAFEAQIRRRFRIVERGAVPGGERILYSYAPLPHTLGA